MSNNQEETKETMDVTEPEVVSLDSLEEEPTFTLISNDEKKFETKKKYLDISKLIFTSIESNPHEVDLPVDVKSNILAIIMEYIEHHKGIQGAEIAKPLRSNVMKEVCKDEWDADFIDNLATDRQLLYDVALASNYLDIHSLLHLCSAKIMSLIKGKPLKDIKEILFIKDKDKKADEDNSGKREV
jgi:S-phase kinase-associated protein 1